MISTIILEPRSFPRDEAGRALVVRSLSWLVGAAVSGVVRDVVIAASGDLDLAGVADAVGSGLVEAAEEGERLRGAAVAVRCDFALVMIAGYAPDAALVEELAQRPGAAARLLAEPATLVQRLSPARAPAVGVLTPVAALRAVRDFAALVRACGSAPALAARARPLP